MKRRKFSLESGAAALQIAHSTLWSLLLQTGTIKLVTAYEMEPRDSEPSIGHMVHNLQNRFRLCARVRHSAIKAVSGISLLLRIHPPIDLHLRDPREIREFEQPFFVGDLESCRGGRLLRSSVRTTHSLRRKPKLLATCGDDISNSDMAGIIVLFAALERVRPVRRVLQDELSNALERRATVLLRSDTSEDLNPGAIVGRMPRSNVAQLGKAARLEWESRLLKDFLDPSPDVARRLGPSDLFTLWLFSLQVCP